MRKPFDVLVKGLLVHPGRGDWTRTSDLLNPIQARYQTALRPDVLSALIIANPARKCKAPRRVGSTVLLRCPLSELSLPALGGIMGALGPRGAT
jgi:hypothetical protein